jgi:hypothetical protein
MEFDIRRSILTGTYLDVYRVPPVLRCEEAYVFEEFILSPYLIVGSFWVKKVP